MTKYELLKSLPFGQRLVDIQPDDILEITRCTTGNFLPGYTQKLTCREAVDAGLFDSVHGTIDVRVRLDPETYEKPSAVSRLRSGYVYAIEIDEK